MFANCYKFKGRGLENWTVSNAKYMSYMFMHCYKFNCDLSNWNVSNDTLIHGVFNYCTTLEKLNKIPIWYKV